MFRRGVSSLIVRLSGTSGDGRYGGNLPDKALKMNRRQCYSLRTAKEGQSTLSSGTHWWVWNPSPVMKRMAAWNTASGDFRKLVELRIYGTSPQSKRDIIVGCTMIFLLQKQNMTCFWTGNQFSPSASCFSVPHEANVQIITRTLFQFACSVKYESLYSS